MARRTDTHTTGPDRMPDGGDCRSVPDHLILTLVPGAVMRAGWPAGAARAALPWLATLGPRDLHRAAWGERVTLRRPRHSAVRLPGAHRQAGTAVLEAVRPGAAQVRLDWSARPAAPTHAGVTVHGAPPTDLPAELLPCLTLPPAQALDAAAPFLRRAGVTRAQLSDGFDLFSRDLTGGPDPAGLRHALTVGPPDATLGRLWLSGPPGPDAHAAAQALFVSASAAARQVRAAREARTARLSLDLQWAAQALRDGHVLPEETLQAAQRLTGALGAALLTPQGALLQAGALDDGSLCRAVRALRLTRSPAGPTCPAAPLLLDLGGAGGWTLLVPLNSPGVSDAAWAFQLPAGPHGWLGDPTNQIWETLRRAARDPVHASGPRGLERRQEGTVTLSPTLLSVLDSVGDSQIPSQIAGRGLAHLTGAGGAVGGAYLTVPGPPDRPAGAGDTGRDLAASAGDVAALGEPQVQAALRRSAGQSGTRQLSRPGAAAVFLSVSPVQVGGQMTGVLALLHASPPPAATLPLLSVLATQVGKACERQRVLRDLAQVREQTFRVLGRVLEYRSFETKGHTDRVTALALRLGQELDLPSTQLAHLRWGAYLHDLGKIAISDDVLHKEGALTDPERRWMRRHVTIGETLLREQGLVPPEVLQIVRHHHERWDGGGYPDGLSGRDIPLLARLFAVVDVFDALSSERPYKAPWSRQDTLRELRHMAGTHLDPALVETFLGMLGAGLPAPPFGALN
ncbi:HD-GYP domain-containing protein [Deinococcus depolymerans]|uniref:HD-GYP domain-containing protein n=1 Tax=Deinococcus depolymerans TaxID=392408 RepID=A0ABP3LHA6_9DEIO